MTHHTPLERQGWHIVALLLLLGGVFGLLRLPGMLTGQLWTVSTRTWLWLALAVPVLHQLYVVIIWRTQLMNGWLTRRFPQNGFRAYVVGFFVLFIARPVTVTLLAVANRGQLGLPYPLLLLLALVALVTAAYLMFSVLRYFGVDRAAGADHFDPAYRAMPLVKKGIFKYTSNGMYLYGFLALYVPGLLLASPAALLVALFQHLYIWVHYYCTELPDMRVIYSST